MQPTRIGLHFGLLQSDELGNGLPSPIAIMAARRVTSL